MKNERDIEAGIYRCRLMANDDGSPAIMLSEHYIYDKGTKEWQDGGGGVQLCFAAEAYSIADNGEDFVKAGQLVYERVGYTLVTGKNAKTPDELIEWKVRRLAEAFGITQAEVFELDRVDPNVLFDAWFDIEIRDYTGRDGKVRKQLNAIGAVGTIGVQPSAPSLKMGKNSKTFSKFATLLRSKEQKEAVMGERKAESVPKADVPKATPPARTAVPSSRPKASTAVPTRKAVNPDAWNVEALYEMWKREKGGTEDEWYADIDKALGEEGIDPGSLTPEQCRKVAEAMGFEAPF